VINNEFVFGFVAFVGGSVCLLSPPPLWLVGERLSDLIERSPPGIAENRFLSSVASFTDDLPHVFESFCDFSRSRCSRFEDARRLDRRPGWDHAHVDCRHSPRDDVAIPQQNRTNAVPIHERAITAVEINQKTVPRPDLEPKMLS